ncbi:MAG: SH3 domain-containing protein [Deltaproteobacteria bacterium]|nr:SH3 domain-containing protein [Deltaproteobacteria bacterium]
MSIAPTCSASLLASLPLVALAGCSASVPAASMPLPERGTDAPSGWGEDTAADTAGDASEGTGEATDAGEDTDVRIVIAADWLNLRSDADGDAPVLRALACGSEVRVRGEADGNWLPITGDGDDGWVKEKYLALPGEAPADPCPGPDPYLDDTPGRVVDLLSVKPYVEQDCRDTTWEGWPFDAQRCTYNNGLKVTVADPSAEQVTAWVADASQMIPALFALEERDRGAWKDGLEIIAAATLYQSSRIFPLEGEIDEGTVYDFDRGVTVGCSTGCYCRINSLTRQQWCDYADHKLGIVDEGDCLDEYTTDSWTDQWAEHCLDNHRASWTGVNHHYRAMAWWANKTMEDAFPDPERADPEAVIDLLDALY